MTKKAQTIKLQDCTINNSLMPLNTSANEIEQNNSNTFEHFVCIPMFVYMNVNS